jgi:hypothetical protein
MADPIRAAYERAFTGSNRTAATWAAFRAGWLSAVTVAPAAPAWCYVHNGAQGSVGASCICGRGLTGAGVQASDGGQR